ncbi:MAG: DUF5989 family protein [Candidatus Omnitrophota bacterium]
MSKLSTVQELWQFVCENKKWVIFPIIFCLLLLGALIILTSNAAVAPFIYTLF